MTIFWLLLLSDNERRKLMQPVVAWRFESAVNVEADIWLGTATAAGIQFEFVKKKKKRQNIPHAVSDH